jgi:flagellar hook-associated protein 2
MASVSFSGLGSGLDTGSIVDQLVAVERSSADKLSTRQGYLTTQVSLVGGISSALAALGTAVRGMDLASELQPRTATSSDSHVSVAASTGAAAGSHAIRVINTAQNQVVSSRGFASTAAGVLGAGGVTLTQPDGSAKNVTWSATDSLTTVADRISAAGANVKGSVVFDGTSYRLVVTSTASGSAGAVTFSDAGDGLDLSNGANVKREARDAEVEVDGITITRPTNVFDDVIPGLTITAKSAHAVGEPDADVGVELDTAALTTKVKDFVAKYNTINAMLHNQLDYTGTKKGENTLFGDSTLRQLQGKLGLLMSDAYGGATLGSIGISRDKGGVMTLDEAKLTKALGDNPDAVGALFVTGGFATKLTTMTDSYTGAGGLLAAKTDSINARKKLMQTEIDRIDDAADRLRTRLEAQFTALEKAMSTLQSQMSYVTSVLGG